VHPRQYRTPTVSPRRGRTSFAAPILTPVGCRPYRLLGRGWACPFRLRGGRRRLGPVLHGRLRRTALDEIRREKCPIRPRKRTRRHGTRAAEKGQQRPRAPQQSPGDGAKSAKKLPHRRKIGDAFLLWVSGHTPQKSSELLFTRMLFRVGNRYSFSFM
jgi:hypothetical protein